MPVHRGSRIIDLFQQAQHPADQDNVEQLVNDLKLIYDQISFKEFVEKFLECLKLCLIHPEDAPSVDAVLNFAARFVAAINCSGTDEEETCPFLKKILEFVTMNHGCDNHLVRSRICVFVDKLLCKLGNEVTIDEQLYNKLVDSMLERMKDKLPGIRVRAISAVYRLQDPFDANCPVVKALSFHLSMDPSVEARRTILRKLAVAAHTLPTIVERIYDVKDFVRKDAFLVLSKCSMSRFTIKQRQMLLFSGLKDRDERVSKCVKKVLLPLWFDHAKNDFVAMLRFLDVETSSETSLLVLQILFKGASVKTILDQVKSHLDEEKLIPQDKLLPENSFFWRCAVQYVHGLKDEELDEDKDTLVQSVLPELTPLTNYIREYFLKSSDNDKQLEFWEQKQRQFILLQLLQLCNVHDLSDELGRSQLKQLCTDLLMSPLTKADAVSVIVSVFSRILPSVDNFLDALVEIVMDLKEPFKDDEGTDLSEEEVEDGEKKENNEIIKISPEVLSKCLTIVVEFLQNENVMTFNPCLRSLVTNFVCPALEARDTTSRVLALHALSNSCLLDVDLAKQYFLLFCFQIANDDMCLVALKGVFDLLLFYGLATFRLSDQIDDKVDDSKKDDEPEKKKRKLKGAMTEENSFVSYSGEANVSGSDLTSDFTDKSANLITMLMSLLDTSSSEIRNVTVEGLCKLIIGGRIISVNLLSKLMLMWFSPVSEDDYVLRQQLGTFFNVYASSYAGSHYMFQQAFLPTLKLLYDAPMDSPLHEIDPDDVAKLMINLMLVRMSKEKGPNPHTSLALAICKEIINTYSANLGNIPTLVRSLLPLQLSFDEPEFLENIKDLCHQVLELLENANNRLLAKYVQKFIMKIDASQSEEVNMRPSDINNTEQTAEADNTLDSGESTSAKKDQVIKNSDATAGRKKDESARTPVETAVADADQENIDEVFEDAIDQDVFDDSDAEGETNVMSPSKSVEESPATSTSGAAQKEEYTLTRINLEKRKVMDQMKTSKNLKDSENVKEEVKRSVVTRRGKSESVDVKRSTRKKSDEKVPSPAKKSKLQLSKSKKSVGAKAMEESVSDEEDDEDDNNVEISSSVSGVRESARKKVALSESVQMSSRTRNREAKRETVTRSGKIIEPKPQLEETRNKNKKLSDEKTPTAARSSRKRSFDDKNSDHSSSESESEENSRKMPAKKIGNKENIDRGRSRLLNNEADTDSTPKKVLENSFEESDGAKRSTRSNANQSNVGAGRRTRSARSAVDVSTPLKTPKKTQKVKKSPLKVASKASPDSSKQSESGRRIENLEILEELSRRSSRRQPVTEETLLGQNRFIKPSPKKKRQSSGSHDSTEEPTPDDGSVTPDTSPTKNTRDETSKFGSKSPTRKALEVTSKSPQTERSSGSKNKRKSLRVELLRVDNIGPRRKDSVRRVSPEKQSLSHRRSDTKINNPAATSTSPTKRHYFSEADSSTQSKSPIKRSSSGEVDTPRKVDTPSKGDIPSKADTPRKVDTPSKVDTSSKVDTLNKQSTRRKIDTPSKVDTPSKRSTRSKVDTSSKQSTRSKVDTPSKQSSSSKVDTLSKVDSSGKTDTPGKVDTPRKGNTPSKVDTSSKVDTLDKRSTRSKLDTLSKVDTTNKRSTRSKVDTPSKENSRSKVDTPAKKNTTSKVSTPVKKENIIKNEPRSPISPSQENVSSSEKRTSTSRSSTTTNKSDSRKSQTDSASSPEKVVSDNSSKDNQKRTRSHIASESESRQSLSLKKGNLRSNRSLSSDPNTSVKSEESVSKKSVSPTKDPINKKDQSGKVEASSPVKSRNQTEESRSRRSQTVKEITTPVRTSRSSERKNDTKSSQSNKMKASTPTRNLSKVGKVNSAMRQSPVVERRAKRSHSLGTKNSTPTNSISPKSVRAIKSQSAKQTSSNKGSISNEKVVIQSESASKRDTRRSESASKRDTRRSESASKNDTRRSESAKKKDMRQSQSASKKDTRQTQSASKKDTRQTQSASKRTSVPKKSLSPAKKETPRKVQVTLKKVQVTPKKSISPDKTDSGRSLSGRKRTQSFKISSSPLRNITTRKSQVANKKTATPYKSPTGSKRVDKRQSQSPKKTFIPKKSVSPVKNVSPTKSPQKKIATTKKSMLPVRKADFRQSPSQKRKSLSPGKKVKSPNLPDKKKPTNLVKSRLAVKKVDSKPVPLVKKKTPVKKVSLSRKSEPKQSLPVRKRVSNTKDSPSPSKKIKLERGRSVVKKANPQKRSLSGTARKTQTVVGARSRSAVAPRARR